MSSVDVYKQISADRGIRGIVFMGEDSVDYIAEGTARKNGFVVLADCVDLSPLESRVDLAYLHRLSEEYLREHTGDFGERWGEKEVRAAAHEGAAKIDNRVADVLLDVLPDLLTMKEYEGIREAAQETLRNFLKSRKSLDDVNFDRGESQLTTSSDYSQRMIEVYTTYVRPMAIPSS